MKNFNLGGTAFAAVLFLGSFLTNTAFAAWPTPVSLSSADGFAIIAGSTITGPGIVTGNLGLSPGSSVTGFPPGILNGVSFIANATAVQAQTDMFAAYNNLSSEIVTSTIPTELGGTTRKAWVYDSAAGTFGITGTVTLDAEGDPNAVFIFKSATTLTTAGSSIVVLTNGAQACNVFWYVGSSATLGGNSIFKGNILALTSATLITSANVEWRIFARNGAITMDGATVSRAICTVTPNSATLTVVKQVVNGTGGSSVPSNFQLYLSQSGSTVVGSQKPGSATGVSYTLSGGSYTVTEVVNTTYSKSYSWDCSATGSIVLGVGSSKTCTITNTFIIPSGSFTPTYVGTSSGNVMNTGSVMNTGAVVPVVTATGAVVITAPVTLVKPRIRVVKTSDRRTPFVYGGGFVVYSYLVTNPGTVALHSVVLTDDKCPIVTLNSWDVNNNFLLESSEVWAFSCRTKVAVTTTNLATVKGSANGRVVYAYDTAVVTVRKAEVPVITPVPRFPKTGQYDGSSASFLDRLFQNLELYLGGIWR